MRNVVIQLSTMLGKSLIFFLSVITIVLSDECFNGKLYYIQSTTDGFTLDATNPFQIQIDYFAASPAQQWRFECGDEPGYVYIIHNATEKALTPQSDYNSALILDNLRSSLDQQWVIYGTGGIVNVHFERLINIKNGYFTAGSMVNLQNDNGTPAQQYVLVEKI